MADEGGTKATETSSGTDDTVPASSSAPERSSVPTIPPPPDTRYLLGEELGRGGMGRVVEAFDTHLQRTVALKEVLPKAGNMDRRFQREVRITARLEHASIVPVYEAGRYADGRPFYVMRRVTGKPLDEVIKHARTLEGRLALLPNALSAIDAIAHAHKRGVIHRDLKPQNILVGELGETVVIDWGLAKVLGDNEEIQDSLEPKLPTAADSLQTQAGSVFGTPGFMPPEQARGDDLGPPGDVYALGATLYQLIVGRPPFGGTSATDVISSTLRHRMEPVLRACPGAPPEMVTVIEKALAFDPEHRYPHAGALAEDVRNFLTGQLVAAHRYTRRQRLARFARRHRAPLVVAALASVGIAALAWVSVSRIRNERDHAEQQSMIANAEREVAKQRAADLRERADQLMLTHARSLVATNPTHAIAVLKQIETTSGPLLEEAKAIARSAVTRGVAWGLPTLPDLATALEMTADGKRVLQMTRHGDLQVVDVDQRRQVVAWKAPTGGTARWVDHDRKVFVDTYGSPVLFDPMTRAVEPLGVEQVRNFSISDDGSRIAIKDDVGIALIETATKQVTRIPGHLPASSLEIARDGSWIAFDEYLEPEQPPPARTKSRKTRFVVVDPSGKVLAQRDTAVSVMGSGANGRLAVVFADGLHELRLSPMPTFVKIPYTADPLERIHSLLYRGDHIIIVGHRALHQWNGRNMFRVREFTDGAMLVRHIATNMLAVTSGDGSITVLHDGLAHSMTVMQRPTGIVRIAAVPGSTRLVATSREALLVWDVGTVFPARVLTVNSAQFATDSMIVSAAALTPEWAWLTVPDGTVVTAEMAARPGIPRGYDTAADGRTLMVLERAADRSTAVIGYPNNSRPFIIEDIAFGLARLVEGDAFLFSPGKGRMFGKVGGEPARELVTLDGDVESLAALGPLGYAALSRKGELVTGRFDGTHFQRTRLPDVGSGAVIVGEPDGSVLVGSGNKLLRWSGGTLEEAARVKSRISWLLPLPVGTVIGLEGDAMLFMAATGDRTPRHMDVNARAVIADHGTRVVSVNERSDLEILELPSLARWTLPHLYTANQFFDVSPSGRRIYQTLGYDAALWTLPEPGSDFAAWLEGLTNAVETDEHVTWPFSPP